MEQMENETIEEKWRKDRTTFTEVSEKYWAIKREGKKTG